MEDKRRLWPFLSVIPLAIASSMGREKKIGGFLVLAVAAIVTIVTFMWDL